MEVKVKLNNLRIAPRKTRQAIDLIRGKEVAQARTILEFTVKRASDPILKLLNSAVASAVNDLKLEESNLYVSKITVGEGPTLKRSFPMSRGKAFPIMKRTSHITLVLSEKNATEKPKSKDQKPKPQTKNKEITSKKNKKATS